MRRCNHEVGLLVLDLDHFKELNDTESHSAGDRALQIAAKAIVGAVRETDIAGRIGGDEFAVLLPNTNSVAAVADKVLKAIRHSLKDKFNLSVSIGFVLNEIEEEVDTSLNELINLADKSMYIAKSEGGNRISGSYPSGKNS